VVDALAATGHLAVEQRAAALVNLLGLAGTSQPDPQLLSQMVMRLTGCATMSAWQPTTTVGRMTLYIPHIRPRRRHSHLAALQP
jgi:hypothetical protein